MHTCTETFWFVPGDDRNDEEIEDEGTYFVATCGTCQGVLLYWVGDKGQHIVNTNQCHHIVNVLPYSHSSITRW